MLPDGHPAGLVHRIDHELQRIIANEHSVNLRFDLSGKDITTFSIGGPLRALAEPATVAGLQFLLQLLKDHGVEYSVVGAGSNLLIDDRGIDRWLVRLGAGLKTLEVEEGAEADTVRVVVGGSYPLMALSREMCARGFAGLAFAGGIPASLGGAVRMNAGAHGGEISQVVESVDIVRSSGELVRLSVGQMNYSYRHSAISSSDVVVSAVLRLRCSSPAVLQAERAHCLEERRSRQPLSQPSAGSVFKNPSTEQSAGMLIEQVGLKGFARGDVEVSAKHANWIVNPLKRGRAADVRDLIALCQERVEQRSGVLLHPEIITLF